MTANGEKMTNSPEMMRSARLFAESFAESAQFQEFEQAFVNFRQDPAAQTALQEFQKKQASLKALLMLNAVSAEDQKELQVLQERFYQAPSVLRYTQAQAELTAISQEVGDLLSNAIGLDFGNSCRTGGCCG
jgi:cell fate (sporulation/competence/biofilm development) regulator YlbF (YheA/YmcA/DUF963 family)